MKLDPKTFTKMLIDFLRPTPTKVIHNNNHTIILFDDGSKTVTKPNGDKYDPYIGFCVAMTAKYFGGKKAAHQAYEALSGCKYGKQPEQVAGLAEKIARATENMNKLAEAFREANTRKQTEQKAESLPFFGNVENLTAGGIDTTAINAEPKAESLPILQSVARYCYTCRYFNVLLDEEPCKSCKKKANDDSRYPSWQAPLQTSNEQVLAVDEKEGEVEPFQMCYNCKHLMVLIHNEPCKTCRSKSTYDDRYPDWKKKDEIKESAK